MIYEYRIYDVLPGKMDVINHRFRNFYLRHFKEHDFRVLGFWEPMTGASNQLHYLLAFDDAGAWQRQWEAVETDPRYAEERRAIAQEGLVVPKITNMLLRPTDYSPAK